MYNQTQFAASQADRESQLRHAAQQQAAQHSTTTVRVGPVFGPLLARLGAGMIAAGTHLHERYAEYQAEEAAAPCPEVWAVPGR